MGKKMGEMIELTAADGHTLSAYHAEPETDPRAGIVVIQEVFGVNAHIRSVCDSFAAEGYAAMAPALFDRLERGVELEYDEAGISHGRALRTELGWTSPLLDVSAATTVFKDRRHRVGVVGYCWGASITWLSATRLDVDCAVCYYGAQIVDFCEEQPRCPVILHFGEKDELIPPENVERIREAQADIPLHLYPTGHGFNCDARADFHKKSSNLARERTLKFFAQHIG